MHANTIVPSPRRFRIAIAAAVLGLAPCWPLTAQNLLPNPGFEDGTNRPTGWRVADGAGEWTTSARSGRHAVMVAGTGTDSALWRTERLKLLAGGLYRLNFQARLDAGASGGCEISGISRVNRDFNAAESWQRHGFVFSVPNDSDGEYLRLGQWQVKGRVLYDDVELLPVLVTHARPEWNGAQVELGEAESIEGGVYRFRPLFGWAGADYHRVLWRNRASFNSDRWVFGPGAEVVYRFALPRLSQTTGRVRVNVNYHTAGALRVEAGNDGKTWTPVATFDGKRLTGTNALPASLFPAREIYLRLATPDKPVSLQVNSLEYEAALDRPVADATGQTWFLAVQQQVPEVAVSLRSLDPDHGQTSMQADFWLTNRSALPLHVAASLVATPGDGIRLKPQAVAPGNVARYQLAALVTQPGAHRLEARFTDDTGRALFAGVTEASRPLLFDPRPGYLAQTGKDFGVWWCEGPWKVGRESPMPARQERDFVRPVTVSAARGEYEPAQIILTPITTNAGTLLSARVAALRSANREPAPITVALAEVGYVQVTHPTDGSSERGWYPDPLPPLRTPLKLERKNLPLWLTFHVAREARPGDYTGELALEFESETARVPLAVHVYDFALPQETHLKSAFGLGTDTINRYHRLTNRADKVAVFEKYLKNFAEHRIAPYSFFEYAPMDIRFVGEGGNKRAQVDFTRFDAAAAKWLDEEKLTTFLLPLRGMGGGTFHSRHLGTLEGFQEGTPEHARLFQDYLSQIERHLRERGWLDKAYTYWFDEPDRKDYQFVVDGMKRIRSAAPGLRRMLTEQPEPELLGNVEIWCGLTPEWTPEKVRARRAAGEEVWWYLCTGPKAPYATIFIDHPGTEMRLWPWQSWQYGVQGILVWASTYWTSPAAFPAPRLQDPWTDPMSYVSGYDFGPGHVGYWGNGDGRFLYPPRRDPNAATGPNLDDPVSSIRWENLRDGMEDYEYFWLLEQAIQRAGKSNADGALLAEARGLLKVPEGISKDLTHFTTDARLLLAHRDKVARMIERLK